MLKRLRMVLLSFLVLLLLIGGVAGFGWWTLKQAADNLVVQISPFAEMKYDSLVVDPMTNEVGLKGVSLRPLMADAAITIDQMLLRSPDWLFLLQAESRLPQGDLPNAARISLQGIEVSLSDAFLEQMAMMNQMAMMQAPAVTEEIKLCGDSPLLIPEQPGQLGYNQLRADWSLGYIFDPVGGQLSVDFDSAVRGMAGIYASVQMEVTGETLNPRQMMMAKPGFRGMEMHFNDQGYNRRIVRYCAEKNGETEDAFYERLRSQTHLQLVNAGFSIPELLVDAVVSLYEPGASIRFQLRPAMALGAEMAMMVESPQQVYDLLNPLLEINGKEVDLQGIHWAELMNPAVDPSQQDSIERPQTVEQQPIEDTTFSDQQDATTFKRPAAIVKEQPVIVDTAPRYRLVSKKDASEHLGRPVKIQSYFGNDIDGVIKSITDEALVVEQRLGSGLATYPVAWDKISELRVYY